MAFRDVVLGIFFLSQSVVGALGNSSLLLHFFGLDFTAYRVRPTDLILKHLTVGNLLTLLCKGVPQSMAAFNLEFYPGDVGCKLLFYLHRVGRGVSIVTTCLLSVFQALIISPSVSRWGELKFKAHRYIGSSMYLSWVLYMLINIIFLMYITGKRNNTTTTNLKDFGYCFSVRHNRATDSLLAAMLTFPDAVCVCLMLWANSSMVLILYRHKQRMQNIHKPSFPRSSLESRATKTILLLVSTFVFFYTLSCIFQVCLSVVYNPNWFLVNMSAIVSGCFPAVCPFLLMSRDSSLSMSGFGRILNRKNP